MLNKAILMGRLTADPELRHTPNNVPVTSFTLAVNRSRQKDQTDFIDIVAWQKTAEFVCNYFKKGMQVAVSGSIQTRSWKDKEGNTRKTTEIVAEDCFFADSKREGSGGGAPFSEPFANTPKASPAAKPFEISMDNDFKEIDNDDDLPF